MNVKESSRSSCEACARCKAKPKLFKRLLVAVDNSEQSEFAVDAASRLACQLHAEVMLTHVCVLPPSSVPQIAFMTPDVLTVCMDAGEALLESVKARMPEPLHTVTDLRQGDPATEILKAAQFCDADLIVMGTHARGRLAQAVLGSVARAVTQKATCPVLTVAHPLLHDDARSSQINPNCCRVTVS